MILKRDDIFFRFLSGVLASALTLTAVVEHYARAGSGRVNGRSNEMINVKAKILLIDSFPCTNKALEGTRFG